MIRKNNLLRDHMREFHTAHNYLNRIAMEGICH